VRDDAMTIALCQGDRVKAV